MYEAFFGFNEKPFSVTPNARFFYTNHWYREAYANLLYGIRERKGFMMLTGEVGTGKTTILRRLMDNLDASVPFVFFYNTALTFEELLTFICEELDLKVSGAGNLAKIQALNKFLIEQLRKGSTAVLFIDEAQNLREEVFENLRLLSNLETSSEKLLQIVLAGQPELEVKLGCTELRQLKQRIFSQSRLHSLSEEEVAAFIDYRLEAVGCERKDLFPREAIRQIADSSKGIPRLVNIICDNALLIAFAAAKKRVSAEIIKEVARDLQLALPDPDRVREIKTLATPYGWKHERKHQDELPYVVSERASTGRIEHPRRSEEVIDPSAGVATVEPVLAKSATDALPQCLAILTTALTEAMGPIAPIVVRTHVSSFDDSLRMLPKASLEKLVELVSSEILNDVLRAGFQKKMSTVIGGLA